MRVLIADDHALFRRGIAEVIDEQPDMTVVAQAGDGDEALRRVRELGPQGVDLVLMDIDMPGVSGIAATERISREFPDLPVVMLTVSTLESDLFDAIRAGAIGYFTKSLAPEAMVKNLRSFRENDTLPINRTMATKVLAYFRDASPKTRQSPREPETSLTDREHEVLELIAEGRRDREIADLLFVTESTVKKHVQNILRKLHARNRTEAVGALQRRLG